MLVSYWIVSLLVSKVLSFTVSPAGIVAERQSAWTSRRVSVSLASDEVTSAELVFDTQEEKDEVVGNLVADDEWNGLSLELTEVVRMAVVEDLKKNARDFLGKDDYEIGDFSKEIDARVKVEVARMRGKDEYEIGDFVAVMDEASKKLVEEQTGKPYDTGDLSREIDKRVKETVARFCGKDEYVFGDLTKEMGKRISSRVLEFTGKPGYELGDVSRAIDERRQAWVKEFLGEEAAANYQFGDITKKFLGQVSGKGSDYKFGDLTKKIAGSIFGGKKDKQ